MSQAIRPQQGFGLRKTALKSSLELIIMNNCNECACITLYNKRNLQ